MMDVSSCHGVVVKNHLCSQTLDLLQVFPAEIIFKIFCYLDLRSLCLCRCLSERWRTQVNLYLGSVIRLDFVPHEAILTECGLKHQLAYANNLQVLHLDRCWPSVTEENLFVIAQNCSKLSVFTASRCKGITDVALEAVAENCPQLTEVDLSSCFKISDAGVIALSKHCSNLQELHVSSCYGVTDKSIVSLSQQCLGLKELDVSWCFHVTDASLKLFLSPECTLKLLRIKDCNRVSQGVVSQLITKGIIPDDHGTINGIEVTRVIRRGASAVHYIPQAVTEGTEVELVVDWQRRFDHMQQHSGQHLVSAIIENNFGYETTSWELGKLRSHIELSCKKLTAEEMNWIEKTANEIIRSSSPVNVHVYPSAACPELKTASTRGLPDDHEGPVRVIEIPGIDRNMCCGTHVSNLSQVQVIKLFPDTESMRGGTRLFFIAGDRVLKYLGKALDNERALTKMLSTGPDEHPKAVDRIQSSFKSLNKTAKSQLKELAQLEGYQLKATRQAETYFYVHRENGDMEYMNTLVNELSDQGLPVLVTVGPDKGPGQFLLFGEEKQVSQIGPKIASVLEGKGGGKKGRYQGKVNTLKTRKEAEELLKKCSTMSINGS